MRFLAGLALLVAGATSANAATIGRADIGFEDVALGAYSSLQVGDYVFSTTAPDGLKVVAGDPTGATANASRTLALVGVGALRIERGDGRAFSVKNLDASALLVEPGFTFTSLGFESMGGGIYTPAPYLAPTFVRFNDAQSLIDDLTVGLRDTTSFRRLSGVLAFDNFVATQVASVPLPASLPMLGAAALGLALLRRRAPPAA